MIIDLILDRKEEKEFSGKDNYNPEAFYLDCMEYGKIAFDITRAMDCGTETEVKEALASYVLDNGYNPDIVDFINSVEWL